MYPVMMEHFYLVMSFWYIFVHILVYLHICRSTTVSHRTKIELKSNYFPQMYFLRVFLSYGKIVYIFCNIVGLYVCFWTTQILKRNFISSATHFVMLTYDLQLCMLNTRIPADRESFICFFLLSVCFAFLFGLIFISFLPLFFFIYFLFACLLSFLPVCYRSVWLAFCLHVKHLQKFNIAVVCGINEQIYSHFGKW